MLLMYTEYLFKASVIAFFIIFQKTFNVQRIIV